MKKPSELKQLILREGRTQRDICEALRWDESKLSHFITGRRIPTEEDIKALARELDLHRGLLSIAEDMENPADVRLKALAGLVSCLGLAEMPGPRNEFKKRRRKLFRTQALAAEAFGVGQSTISEWENGKRPVPGIAFKLLNCRELLDKAIHPGQL